MNQSNISNKRHAVARAKRSNKKSPIKRFFFTIVVIIIVGVVGAYLYYNSWYKSALSYTKSESSTSVNFEVTQGESTDSVAKRLEAEGLIKGDLAFKWYLRQEGKGGEIQAGTFQIPENSTMEQILEILSNAVDLEVVRVTIIEGYRLSQTRDTLAKAFEGKAGAVFSKTEFDTITKNPDSVQFTGNIQGFLDTYKPEGKSLEGFLYPDTYEFENTATTQVVLEKLLQNFINKVDSLDKDENFYSDLVLASIVERESFTNDERDEIASVFANRLEINMALESDATVNYATGKSNPRPTYEDLRTDSPYNTYKYPGLPPTPINSPRIQSIQAAINPADTNYYYFIHEQDGPNAGRVHFASTLAGHNENVRKYLD